MNTNTNETTRGQEPCPGQAANELLAMLDMLLKAAGESDLEFLDDTLENYASSMIEKAGFVSGWFDSGGVERIMGENGATGRPAETPESLEKTVARNIRMVASEHDDPKVRGDAERLAAEVESEGDDEPSSEGIDILRWTETATAALDGVQDVILAGLNHVDSSDLTDKTGVGCLWVAFREVKRITDDLEALNSKMAKNRPQFHNVAVEPKGGAA